jgi:putative membrane protein
VKILIGLVVNALALLAADFLLGGIKIVDFNVLLLSALVFGLVNAFLKPILALISLPITILTFGIFALIINAALLGLAAWLVPGFDITNFWSAFLGAIVVSLVSTILHALLHPKPAY